jgi:hypothetical protein
MLDCAALLPSKASNRLTHTQLFILTTARQHQSTTTASGAWHAAATPQTLKPCIIDNSLFVLQMAVESHTHAAGFI